MAARWWSVCGWNMAQFWDIVARYRLEPGTRALLEAMLAAGQPELRLNTPVARVADDGKSVRVTTRSGETFSAPVVILAVPVNVWPSIDFEPPLSKPKRDAARESIGCPGGAKVWVHVRNHMPRLYAQLPEGYPFNLVWTYADLDEGQLLVCLSGDPTFEITDDQVADALHLVLPEADIAGIRAHDWVHDEFSRGGWSYYKPGQITKYLADLQRAEGRLVFATADVASGWSGSIDGAIESGLEAARKVRESTECD